MNTLELREDSTLTACLIRGAGISTGSQLQKQRRVLNSFTKALSVKYIDCVYSTSDVGVRLIGKLGLVQGGNSDTETSSV